VFGPSIPSAAALRSAFIRLHVRALNPALARNPAITRRLATAPLAGHELRSEHKVRLVLVVRPTPESEVFDFRTPAASDGLDVIELQVPTLVTSVPVRSQERAPSPIPLPHRPPDMCRDVSSELRSLLERMPNCF